ncbi:MAG: hypothetical protein HYU97_00080 [Deltaproteobacteria bacterium]|nr:hypothetical protein [Deltaproteobacteria bacterium]
MVDGRNAAVAVGRLGEMGDLPIPRPSPPPEVGSVPFGKPAMQGGRWYTFADLRKNFADGVCTDLGFLRVTPDWQIAFDLAVSQAIPHGEEGVRLFVNGADLSGGDIPLVAGVNVVTMRPWDAVLPLQSWYVNYDPRGSGGISVFKVLASEGDGAYGLPERSTAIMAPLNQDIELNNSVGQDGERDTMPRRIDLAEGGRVRLQVTSVMPGVQGLQVRVVVEGGQSVQVQQLNRERKRETIEVLGPAYLELGLDANDGNAQRENHRLFGRDLNGHFL